MEVIMKKITFGGNEVTLKGSQIKVGDEGIDYIAVNKDLSPYNFFENTGNQVKVISVAPSLDTSVCAFQAEEFNKKIEDLKDDVALVTITVDLPFAQKRFCSSHDTENGVVVSDYKDLDFGKKYGFVIDEFRLLARGVIIIDGDNTVKYVEFVPEVTDHINYEKAMKAVEDLV
jgi:thiol peroxidase